MARIPEHGFLQIYGFIRTDGLAAGALCTLQLVYLNIPLNFRSLAGAFPFNLYCFFRAEVLAEYTIIAFILVHKDLLERHRIIRCGFTFEQDEGITEPGADSAEIALFSVNFDLSFCPFF